MSLLLLLGSSSTVTNPEAVTGEAVDVDTATATLHGTVDPNGAATIWTFQYVTDAQFQATGWTGAPVSPPNPFGNAGSGTTPVPVSTDLAGLLPGTTYHYRLVARHGTTGPIGAGSAETFATAGVAPAVSIDYAGDRWQAALAGPHEPVVAAYLLYAGDEIELPTLVDGSVRLDADAASRAQCDLTFADDGTLGWVPTNAASPLVPYDREIRVERGIRYGDGSVETVSLGVFRIDDVVVDDSGSELSVAISGLDRSARIIDAKFEEPYQIPAGTNYRTAILSTIQAVWSDVPHDLAATTYTTPDVFPAEEGSDRWAFCQKMAAAIAMQLYFDGAGTLRMEPILQFVSGDPVWEIAEGEQGVLVRASLQWSRQSSFNKAIVTGAPLEGTDIPARGVAADNNPLSPTYYEGPFGKVPDFFHDDMVKSDAQAADAAAARLARQLGTTQSVSFGAVVNAKLRPNQVVRIDRERMGIAAEDHVIASLTIPLSADGEMSGNTRATVVV